MGRKCINAVCIAWGDYRPASLVSVGDHLSAQGYFMGRATFEFIITIGFTAYSAVSVKLVKFAVMSPVQPVL